MDKSKYEIKKEWRTTADGQVFEARAITKKAKRIIARATGHLPLDTGADLRTYYGEDGMRAVEDSITETCDLLAADFPE